MCARNAENAWFIRSLRSRPKRRLATPPPSIYFTLRRRRLKYRQHAIHRLTSRTRFFNFHAYKYFSSKNKIISVKFPRKYLGIALGILSEHRTNNMSRDFSYKFSRILSIVFSRNCTTDWIENQKSSEKIFWSFFRIFSINMHIVRSGSVSKILINY